MRARAFRCEHVSLVGCHTYAWRWKRAKLREMCCEVSDQRPILGLCERWVCLTTLSRPAVVGGLEDDSIDCISNYRYIPSGVSTYFIPAYLPYNNPYCT